MKINSKVLAAVIFIVIFGGVMITTAIGWWSTETTKKAAVFTEGDFAGQPNPADIRGSYTFGDVEKNFGIPVGVMAEAFDITSDGNLAEFGVKDLETYYLGRIPEGTEIGTSSIRWFVALYSGLPYEVGEDTWLPRQAVDILIGLGTLTPEQESLIMTRSIELLPSGNVIESTPVVESGATAVVEETAVPTEHVAPDRTMRGQTTFQELLDWGLTPEQIAAAIGAPMPTPSMVVKDWCTSKGLEYSPTKEALQKLLDELP